MKIYAVEILSINEKKLEYLNLLISLEKKIRIDNLIKTTDKVRTLIDEILIRTIIMQELNIRNSQIEFKKNTYGKPYLHGYTNFYFNMSHSGKFVICAIDEKPVGIDIEQIKCIEFKEIAQNFFSQEEFNYIDNQTIDIQLNKFYEIWTLKESYIKYCGQGLFIPLNSFSIDLKDNGNIKVISKNMCKKCNLMLFDIHSQYKMAVCSASEYISNLIIRLDQNKLIDKFLRLQ